MKFVVMLSFYENPRDAGDETLQNLKDQLAIEQTQLEIDKIAYEKGM